MELTTVSKETLGQYLKRVRKIRGHTIASVCDYLGCTRHLLWRLESDITYPTLLIAARLSVFYSIPLPYLGSKVMHMDAISVIPKGKQGKKK